MVGKLPEAQWDDHALKPLRYIVGRDNQVDTEGYQRLFGRTCGIFRMNLSDWLLNIPKIV